jgi:hypothetical protein
MNRILSLIMAAVMMLSTVSVLASCSSAQKSTAPEYVSEEMREEHIAMLIGDGEVIAHNVKTTTYDEELEMEIVNETWTVDPAYATAAGKNVSNYTITNEDGTTTNIKQGITKMSLIMENAKYALYMDLTDGKDADLAAQGDSLTG